MTGNYFIFLIACIFGGMANAFQSGNDDALIHDTLDNLKKKKTIPTLKNDIEKLTQQSGILPLLYSNKIDFLNI